MEMEMKLAIRLILVSILISSGSLAADVIRLNGGQILEGKIIDESDKLLVIETGTGTFTIRKEDILEREIPGGKKIVRLNREGVTPLGTAGRSFIPFYSGFYETEDEEFGLLFATLQGIYALGTLDNMPGLRRDIGWDNPQYWKGPLDHGQSANEFLQGLNLSAFFNGNVVDNYFTLEYLTKYNDSYYPVKTVLTQKVRSKKDSDSNFRNNLRGYLITSLIHAGLTYWHVSSYEGGSWLSRESEGPTPGRVYGYVVPSGKDSVHFGMMMVF
ncbi:MAG TPA: hypothetical protein DEA96_16330 [Leptospiraceae bacterium]|nr:hypothetical protein [Spirochaetaceae bacterium]HBS06537.1 hypothetical protein [Leptospiraceae bacterium]|tara:strand:+ start:5002 stop:5814 length:813 start_codon:yes stop_codon:yes gene_type:complete